VIEDEGEEEMEGSNVADDDVFEASGSKVEERLGGN